VEMLRRWTIEELREKIFSMRACDASLHKV